MSKKSRRGKAGSKRFVMLEFYILNSSAYLDLSPIARATYIEVKKRYNGANNGSIGLGVRELADAIKRSESTAKRALDELIEHGFIEIGTPSSFDQKRLTREWLLTEYRDDRSGTLPRKSFMRWKAGIGVPPAPEGKRNAVPQAKPVAPYVAPAHDETGKEATDSATSDTGKAKLAPPQCHGRHASTSAPSGGRKPFGPPVSVLRRLAANRSGSPTPAGLPPTVSDRHPDVHIETRQVDTERMGAGEVDAVLSPAHPDATVSTKAQPRGQQEEVGVESSGSRNTTGTRLSANRGPSEEDRTNRRPSKTEEVDPLIAIVLRTFPGARVVH